MQQRKSIRMRRRRIPATAIPTIAKDEMLIRLSATPITSKPAKVDRKEMEFKNREFHG